MVESNAATMSFKKSSGGKLFNIPRPYNADYPQRSDGSVIFYRADWMQKLGLTEPKTVDELL